MAADVEQSENSLQEVVVTAQRRTESLQNVPIAVTALTAATLSNSGVSSTNDLAMLAPSLVTAQFSGFGQYYIRGVGENLLAASAQPGVTVYQDGVPDQTVITKLDDLIGTERIEVLYGPQGTLYGRNAVGGAVNIVTLMPSNTLQAAVNVTGGNFSDKEISGYISGPVSDRVSVGLYAGASDRDTFYKFVTPPPPGQITTEKFDAARLVIVAEPVDDLKITGSAEYDYSRSIEGAAFRQGAINATGFALGSPRIVGPYLIEANAPLNFSVDAYRATVRIEKTFAWADLISITGYQHTNLAETNDPTATNTPALVITSGTVDPNIWQFSQEVRLQSPGSQALQWVAGVYDDTLTSGEFPQPSSVNGIYDPAYVQQRTDSLAGFAQTTIPIDAWRLTLGARYERDKVRKEDASQTTYAGDSSSDPITSSIDYPNVSTNFDAFTPKVTLAYAQGNILPYLTYSTGYKAGQYNISTAASPDAVAPERLKDLEAGVKSEFFDRRLRVNLSAFRYWYKDLQVEALETENGQPESVLSNAATAKMYGGELEVTALVAPGLTIRDAAGFLHSEYTSFPAAIAYIPAAVGNNDVRINAAGNPTPQAPDFTNSLSFDYTRELADRSAASANVTWAYNSGFAWDASNLFRQGAYSLVNLSVGYTLPGGKLKITGWVKNLTNTFYEEAILPYALGTLDADAPPRMYGATFSYKY